MTTNLTRRTYFRETFSFDEQPTREEMKQLMNEGFRLDRKNLLWERAIATTGRHGNEELPELLNIEPEQEEAAEPKAA